MLILEDNINLMPKTRLSQEEIQLREIIGSKLRAILKNKDIKDKHLAAGLGYSGSWLSWIMKGKRGLTILGHLKVAKYLNVSPAEFLPKNEIPVSLKDLDKYLEKKILDIIEENKIKNKEV